MVERYAESLAIAESYQGAAAGRALALAANLADARDRFPFANAAASRSMAGSRIQTDVADSLQKRMERLETSYLAALEAIRPDPGLALTLPGVAIIGDLLYYSDDQCVSLSSPQGFFWIELLSAVARGEDPDAAAARMQADVAALLESIMPGARGLYTDSVYRYRLWPSKVVPYCFTNVDAGHQDLVRQAMAAWADATRDGAGQGIKFSETVFANDSEKWLFFNTGFPIMLEISNVGSLSNYRVGETDVLAQKIRLSTNQIESQYIFTAKHEIGHAIGLEHEHSRSDRDAYVYSEGFLTSSIDYRLIPATVTSQKWVYRPLWGWFPWWTQVDVSSVYSHIVEKADNYIQADKFDYYSIMLYSSNDQPYGVFAKTRYSPSATQYTNGYWMIQYSKLIITRTDANSARALWDLSPLTN